MRVALLGAVIAVAVAVACSVSLDDPAGRACDDAHACSGGRVCTAGVCAVPTDAGVTCTYVVADTGSDDAPGTAAAPFKTVTHLLDMLGPGVIGCLRAGTYPADALAAKGGTAGSPAIVRSYPGERAKLVGRLLVMPSAPFFVLAELDIDGTNAQGDSGPVVLATDFTIQDSDLTSRNKDGCLRLGAPPDGDASRALVQRNRIHDCGVQPTNSASGVKIASGSDIRIVDNVIWGNKDHGILFYPHATRSTAIGNVIDGNGVNVALGGTTDQTSSDDVIEHNVITFPAEADNVLAFFEAGAIGQNNVVRQNCLFGGNVAVSPTGFSASENVTADPLYVDRGKHDYRLQPGSPCAALLAHP